jgi:hypothetical protein
VPEDARAIVPNYVADRYIECGLVYNTLGVQNTQLQMVGRLGKKKNVDFFL